MHVSDLVKLLSSLPGDLTVMIETTFHHCEQAPLRTVHVSNEKDVVVLCEHWLEVKQQTVIGFDGVEYETKGLS